MTDGDLATYLAVDAEYALRGHVTTPQTFFEAMSEQLPDVHFTIQQQDAVSMMAAMIREQRLEGILQGLRLAGLLNEAPKRPRTSPQTDGVGFRIGELKEAIGDQAHDGAEARAGESAHGD